MQSIVSIHGQEHKVHVHPLKSLKARGFLVFLIIILLGVPFPGSPFSPADLTSGLFSTINGFTAGLLSITNADLTIHSDTTGMYLHFLNALVLSVWISFLWFFFKPQGTSTELIKYIANTIARYWLIFELFAYGWSKVFHWQFYLPEPNVLYTPAGNISSDLFYWSSMGSSSIYSLVTGMAEILAAVLLIFRRTIFAGAVFALFILANVFLINISFNISVKCFSFFLLLMALSILIYEWINVFPKKYESIWVPLFRFVHPVKYHVTKSIVIILFLGISLWPYISSGNFNDAKEKRPYLHGAYEVNSFLMNNQERLPLTTDPLRWRRVFIHRSGYLIVQFMDDHQQDFKIQMDIKGKRMRLIEQVEQKEFAVFHFFTNSKDELIRLEGVANKQDLFISLKTIPYKSMPLLNTEFSWTSDQQ